MKGEKEWTQYIAVQSADPKNSAKFTKYDFENGKFPLSIKVGLFCLNYKLNDAFSVKLLNAVHIAWLLAAWWTVKICNQQTILLEIMWTVNVCANKIGRMFCYNKRDIYESIISGNWFSTRTNLLRYLSVEVRGQMHWLFLSVLFKFRQRSIYVDMVETESTIITVATGRWSAVHLRTSWVSRISG